MQENLTAPLESNGLIPPEDHFHGSEIATIGLAHGINDMFFAFIPTLQPLLMEKLALTNAQAGLFSFFLQGPSLLQPLIGHIADRRNLRWVIILAPTLSAIALSLVGYAPSFGWLALLMIIAGFSTAGFHAIAPVITASRSGQKIGRGMGTFMVFGEMFYGLGPLIVVAVVGALTIYGLPWLIACGLFISIVLFLRFKDLTTTKNRSLEQSPLTQADIRAISVILLPILTHIFVTSFLYSNVLNFLPTFLTNEGASFEFSGMAFSIIEISGTVGVFLYSRFSDRIGQRIVIFLTTLVMPIFSILFLQVQGWMQVPMLIGTGFLAFSANPAFMAIIQNHFPESRSLTNGIYMAAAFVLRSIAAILVGFLADHFGLRTVFTFSAWGAFLAIPLVFLLPKK
ncbi:MAG: MFS transporter [Anaerolineae bacterium]|nr:MFS transporter [Anaerolineae bacterium]